MLTPSVTLGQLEEETSHTSAVNVKRTWANYGLGRTGRRRRQGEEFLYQAVQVRNVWLAMGDIFVN